MEFLVNGKPLVPKWEYAGFKEDENERFYSLEDITKAKIIRKWFLMRVNLFDLLEVLDSKKDLCVLFFKSFKR